MKYSLIVIAVLFVILLDVTMAKSQKDEVIESAYQFQKWCKHLSYRYFRKKKQQPYNWGATTYRELNDYQTEGSWKVDNLKRYVTCTIHIGERAKYTIMEIQ